MLQWKTIPDKRIRASFQAQGGSNADAVQSDLVAIWQKTLEELALRCDENAWDILIVQLITQCGMVVIFPARKDAGELHEAAFDVGLTVESWSEAYEALPDPDDGESKFSKAYSRLHKNQVRALKSAISDPQLKAKFAVLKRRTSFAVFCVDEGGTRIRDRWEFLWGNRPPKRDFATARELFEHLFHKAELTPHYSMRIQDDKVVAVNWFGHAFTDRFLDLIEQVPDVATLCDALSVFVLTATRVTPSGVNRLKALLPGVGFAVVSNQEFENGIDKWKEHRTPVVANENLASCYRPGACYQCRGSGKCYCIRKGPGNPTGCARCSGTGNCHMCHGTGNSQLDAEPRRCR
jgi:hypothetical protein